MVGDPKEYIEKYGGKAGAYFYLRDLGGFDQHLLPLVYLNKDQSAEEIMRLFPATMPGQIVRGTHPNDYDGLVDILKTVPRNSSRQIDHAELLQMIGAVRRNAATDEVRSYNEYEGNPYDGKIGIMIQPFVFGPKGSVVEHPHERGTYLIDFVDTSYDDDRHDRIIAMGTEIKRHRYSFLTGDVPMFVRKIIELYQRVRETGFIDHDVSFQMEFGRNIQFPEKDLVLFYQARPFLPFAEPTFELEGMEEYSCFGITPPEGLVLPVIKSIGGSEVMDQTEPFAMFLNTTYKKLSPFVQPRNISAFVPMGVGVESLEHCTYRWVKKAQVSILSFLTQEGVVREVNTGDQVKVISNGLHFKIEKV